MSTIESMRFICSGCGYRARIPSSYAGKVILCPGCQQMQIANSDSGDATGDTVRVSKVATAQVGSGKFSAPDAEGLLRFTCGGCGYTAKLASTYAGKAISCPQCKSPQLIPPLQGPEISVGKALPSSALEPAAGAADDGLSFDDEPSAKATEKAPMPPKLPKSPTSPTARVADSADEISFDLEPAAAPASGRSDNDATKPTAVAKAALKSSSAPGLKSAKPGTGSVVRRGSRAPAAPETADEDDAEDDVPVKPSRPLPPWAQAMKSKLKEPRVMALIGGSLAALILLIVLINGWMGASNAAADFQAKAEANDARAKELEKSKSNAEFELSKVRSELNALKKSDGEVKSALATAMTRSTELSEQAKKAEADKVEEYAKRKKAETDYDDMFAKFKAVEKKRDDEYRISTEIRRKYEEEAKLRKDLKVRLDEAQAAAK